MSGRKEEPVLEHVDERWSYGPMQSSPSSQPSALHTHAQPFIRSLLLVVLLAATTVSAQAQSLYADPKARQVGDVLTIVLDEHTSAQRSSEYENSSQAGMGGDASVSSPGGSGRFGFQTAFDRETANLNESAQSDLLRGTMTARVVGVDQGGNLRIEGERRLNVNGVTHLMSVQGVIRPLDVRYDNTLLSHQIADAQVEYRRDGFARHIIKPATLTKLGALAVLGAAVAYAFQQ